MKKVIFLLMMMMCAVVNAQNYVGSSKFTDNMSVTVQGGVLTQFDNFYSGHTAMAPIVVVGVDKYVNPWFGFGIEGRTLIGTGNGMYNTHTAFDAVNLSGNFKFNVLNMFNSNPKMFEPVVYTGLGWGHHTSELWSGKHMNYTTLRTGAELNFNLSKEREWTVVINPSVVWNNYNSRKLNKHYGNFELTAGLVYHFKTSNGTRFFVKPHLYDAAEVAKLNARIKELENRKPEIKVVERVKEVPVVKPNLSALINFAKGSAELSPEAKAVLDKIPAGSTVKVTGTTSPEGSTKFNIELSEARASAVKEYLEGRGVKVESAKGNEAGRAAFVTE